MYIYNSNVRGQERFSHYNIQQHVSDTDTQMSSIFGKKTASKLFGVLNVRSISSVIVTVDLTSTPDNKANHSGR